MEQFKHKPINLDRLLFGLFDFAQGDIQCELFQALLRPPEVVMEYEALSYTWGGKEKPDDIIIGECKFEVTQNLYLALRHLHCPHETESYGVALSILTRATKKSEDIKFDRWHRYTIRLAESVYG